MSVLLRREWKRLPAIIMIGVLLALIGGLIGIYQLSTELLIACISMSGAATLIVMTAYDGEQLRGSLLTLCAIVLGFLLAVTSAENLEIALIILVIPMGITALAWFLIVREPEGGS